MPSFTRESGGTLHVAVMGVNRIGKVRLYMRQLLDIGLVEDALAEYDRLSQDERQRLWDLTSTRIPQWYGKYVYGALDDLEISVAAALIESGRSGEAETLLDSATERLRENAEQYLNRFELNPLYRLQQVAFLQEYMFSELEPDEFYDVFVWGNRGGLPYPVVPALSRRSPRGHPGWLWALAAGSPPVRRLGIRYLQAQEPDMASYLRGTAFPLPRELSSDWRAPLGDEYSEL